MKADCWKQSLCLSAAAGLAFIGTGTAHAQESAQAQGSHPQATVDTSEIIVTARKRSESLLEVPVIMTAISDDKLQKLQVNRIDDLPRLVPGLTIGKGPLAIGALVSLRGVGTSQQDPSIDQSVSLNIDGLSLGQGLAFASGMFDLAQIEVLKGPQALFYGKSSPGGVIALRTADPTDSTEVIARAGYEFEADEKTAELIVSGPIGNTLKARLAGQYSRARGYFRNEAVAIPGTGARDPLYHRLSRSHSYQVRGTLLWEPSADFHARLKMNLVRDYANDADQRQLKSCPEGTEQPVAPIPVSFISGDDCKLNRVLHSVYHDPAAFPGIINDGVPFLRVLQKYGTLELDYNLTPRITLTSTTGLYRLRSLSLTNTHGSTALGPTLGISSGYDRNEFTQELRLNSDFVSPLNFTAGAFYQKGHFKDGVTIQGNAALGLDSIHSDGYTKVDIETFSLFGQARWKVVPDLEIALGTRWTDERRTQDPFNLLTQAPVPVAVDRIHTSNFSPELTLSYTPTDSLTVFGSLKQAYKSGSFSAGTVPNPGADNSFGDEKVRGGEAGVKTRLAGGSLQANLAAYYYKYSGLQVGAIEPADNGVPIIRVVNAGAARTYGVEFDATYRPPTIDGLTLTGALNYNNGRYSELNTVPCWSGQTISRGCDQFPNPQTGRNTAQDLSGTPLIRAPDWQATFGFDYELPVGNNMAIAITNSNQYSSRFVTFIAIGRPHDDNFQKAFLKSDLSVALRGPDERWEVALVGNNLTDKITAANCSASNAQGGLIFGDVTGAQDPGDSGLGEASCNVQRGRSVWLRLTFRPGF
ncbi:TonB-dependent receptor [Novosphingobium album (ex Liu et al. 2023)]|uniref:TonB-dependent receptor n=1 Tax=Novosphingobium album (ex Liu et al. 2023) TaxID=3031130 RepID=A0ABT5WSF7_9SPHN|nr:TonB-dependent receptor [Novosphingobium album (ex Liu et al. 2023)]MDE8652975.1 TonB-dependent receptor [Novosphingobium album (ex Liu et al. 2023)]